MNMKQTNKKKTALSKKRKTGLNTNRLKELLLGVVFVAIATYLFYIATATVLNIDNLKGELGLIGSFAYRSLITLCGSGKIIIPILFTILGITLIFPQIKMSNIQIIGAFFLAFTILTWLHIPFMSGINAFEMGRMGLGGGVIGALLAYVLDFAFGTIGSKIATVLFGVIALLLFSKGNLFAWIKNIFVKTIQIMKKIISSMFVEVEEDDVPKKETKNVKKKDKKKELSGSDEQEPVLSLPFHSTKNTSTSQEKPFIINNLQDIQDDIDARSSKALQQKKNVISDDVANQHKEKLKVTPQKADVKNEKTTAEITLNDSDEKFIPETNKVKAYKLPPISLLQNNTNKKNITQSELQHNVEQLEQTLNDFAVKGKINAVSVGPAITRYEFQPASGIKVSKIVNLADDIALSLAASGIRIEAPIPGKAAVGIEVPNKSVSTVGLKEVLESKEFTNSQSKLTVALGKDIAGQAVVTDLGKMPHLLIAGSTGSGKSVCMNALIVSILYHATPDEVKFLMVDPKMVELGNYNGIPHLISPVVTDAKKAASALRWAVAEMERRYELFANTGNKDIGRYNAYAKEQLEKCTTEEEKSKIELLPYIVILIDELADLMMVAPADVEDAICRLAQMARAAGMHLVVATQRPSVDVITGIIKANIPSRIAFAVSSQIDSRTILDMGGAEKLLGRGDMLFNPSGIPKPIRIQGVYVTDKEIDRVVEFIKEQGKPTYNENIANMPLKTDEVKEQHNEEEDELIPDCCKLFIESGQASISLLQRRFRVGYSRAARIIDQMEQLGYVGPYEGSKPRSVKITLEQYEEKYGNKS